jgi:hypothetical protein
MRCPTCGSLVESGRAWKSGSNSFYCSEFCADTEDSQFVFTTSRPYKAELDSLYLERLARLLHLRRTTGLFPPSVGGFQLVLRKENGSSI